MTTTPQNTLWQTKVAARLHDPAEKALVLLRDCAGLDDDQALAYTVFQKGIPTAIYDHVQRADGWAAAADRPQWPLSLAQVHWAKTPILIHPLTGYINDLGKYGSLSDNDFKNIKTSSAKHTFSLLQALQKQNHTQSPDQQDWQRTLLTLWRFAPELSKENDNGALGELWKLLPADSRVPDHSIWDHLDLTSAFSGAFAADPEGEAALLSLSIGPVQPFIAAARKVEDLWAGSHLLARLSWEGMKVVCEQLGPDAILFPRLRGVPQVDLWLRDEQGLPKELFQNCEWNRSATDSNPLFSAALPNRFVAVVPRSQVRQIAEKVEQAVRQWLQEIGKTVVGELLKAVRHPEADINPERTPTPFAQMQEQLQGFPEVHWAAVPFSLIRTGNAEGQTGLDVSELSEAMRPFFGVGQGQPCGFFDTPAWKLLQKDLVLTDTKGCKSTFFAPNPGVLYPAIHDLAERVLAAAKAVRPFAQHLQKGWRCSLTGETEWLTTDPAQLNLPPGERNNTLWARIARAKPAWAKAGEHLGALPAIKRLWPTLFANEVGKALGKPSIDRFVVSTHTMALASHLKALDQKLQSPPQSQKSPQPPKSYDFGIGDMLTHEDRTPALPPKLAFLRDSEAARIPAALERLGESDNPEDQHTRAKLQNAIKNVLGHPVEAYYSLLLMDGDRMGAWLAGESSEGKDYAISYRDSFHPQVQKGFDEYAMRFPEIKRYGDQKRALSPNRHLAISGALNDFSLTVVRHVVEQEHLGRLIYAGGDDVLAMLPVADLLPAMQRLRHAYSGHNPEHQKGDCKGLVLHNGFALLNGKLMRMMGTAATASCGAVIAHHQAPLSAVRRELDAAEKRAKNEGGRNAFSITIVKRSGGTLYLTAQWGEPLYLLEKLRNFLADEKVSRRAAYHTLEWLDAYQLPAPEGDGAMLQTLLAYQFDRQAQGAAKAQAPELAQRLTKLCLQAPEAQRFKNLRNFIAVAEFLARETHLAHTDTHHTSCTPSGESA